jgi:hypothetical protein
MQSSCGYSVWIPRWEMWWLLIWTCLAMKAVDNVNAVLLTECWKQAAEKGGEMEIFSISEKLIYIVRLATVLLQQSVWVAHSSACCSRHNDFGHPWQTTTFPVLASVISARSLLMKSLVNRITSRSIQPYRTALPSHPAAPVTVMTTSAPCYWCP